MTRTIGDVMKTTAAVLVALVFASSAPAAGPPRLVKDVEYARAGGEALKLDLAVPARPGPHPVVVCFHGGAWRVGYRQQLSRYVEYLAGQGYAAATVSYRLSPKHKFPAHIEDAKTAVRFLRTRAKEHDLDPDRVAALGFSAGGHLAALLGTTGPDAGFDGPLYPGVSSRVNCVVDFFGPADLSLYAASEGLVDGYMVPFLGKSVRTDPTVYKKASPIEYVSKSAVPLLAVHGTLDVVVPIIHSERLVKKLQDTGCTAEMCVMPARGHFYGGDPDDPTNAVVLKFLGEHLKGTK